MYKSALVITIKAKIFAFEGQLWLFYCSGRQSMIHLRVLKRFKTISEALVPVVLEGLVQHIYSVCGAGILLGIKCVAGRYSCCLREKHNNL